MATKNLGQISAIIISSAEPANNYVLWFDLTSNSLKYYNFNTSTWDTLSGASSIGQIKLNSSDSIGYLADKLHNSLTVSGGLLKVSNPVTSAEKAKWNGQSTTYFVLTHSELATLTPSTGDKAIVADDGAGTKAGYYWSGSTWIKDFDPLWENINLHWANIIDVPSATTILQGVLQLATDTDITTGTNTTKAVTPAQLASIKGTTAGKVPVIGTELSPSPDGDSLFIVGTNVYGKLCTPFQISRLAGNAARVQSDLTPGQTVKVGTTGLISEPVRDFHGTVVPNSNVITLTHNKGIPVDKQAISLTPSVMSGSPQVLSYGNLTINSFDIIAEGYMNGDVSWHLYDLR